MTDLDANGAVLASYVQGAGVDEPLAATLSGTLAFYEADGLGSITSLTNSSGSAVGAYIRDSFGKAITTSNTLGNRFRYTAREWDEETGLYYYRARYYDSATGRFLSEDPILFQGGINFYSYVRNNPARFLDRWGLQSDDLLDRCRLCHMKCDLKFKMDLTVVAFGAWVRGWAGGWGFGRGGNNPANVANASTEAAKECKLTQNYCHANCNFNDCAVMPAPPFCPFPPGWPFNRVRFFASF